MKRQPILTQAESTQLRNLLANCLTNIFINDTICKYLVTDGSETELQILNCCNEHSPELPQIKMAYAIWGRMDLADRHAVLGKFQCLYAGLSATGPVKTKTLLFCALFVHEFTSVFAEAMEWPD
jgi:hypothetical protein